MSKKKEPYSPLWVHIKGQTEQLMGNGRLCSPLDPWAKLIKKHSSKHSSKKTDEDHIAMMQYEFMGSLYLAVDDPVLPVDGHTPFWPADNIHAMIKTQGKSLRLGKKIDSALIVQPPGGKLIYDGPKTRLKLWEDQRFHFSKRTSRGVVSCRPRFVNWEVQFSLDILTELIEVEEIERVIKDAGKYLGLSEWPRRHGLFEVVKFKRERIQIDVPKPKTGGDFTREDTIVTSSGDDSEGARETD